jgi:hypothetical protein
VGFVVPGVQLSMSCLGQKRRVECVLQACPAVPCIGGGVLLSGVAPMLAVAVLFSCRCSPLSTAFVQSLPAQLTLACPLRVPPVCASCVIVMCVAAAAVMHGLLSDNICLIITLIHTDPFVPSVRVSPVFAAVLCSVAAAAVTRAVLLTVCSTSC